MKDDFDYKAASAFLRAKAEKRRRENRQRLYRARRDFENIVALLIERYKPSRIYQWGSLLHEDRFSEISDIDIAVEGILSPEDYFRMLGDAERLTEFPLDLIQMEKIDPIHAEAIYRKGRLIYERGAADTRTDRGTEQNATDPR